MPHFFYSAFLFNALNISEFLTDLLLLGGSKLGKLFTGDQVFPFIGNPQLLCNGQSGVGMIPNQMEYPWSKKCFSVSFCGGVPAF